mgnify:CR=1 FL=1
MMFPATSNNASRRRENELLLHCVRNYPNLVESQRLNGLNGSEIDWDYLIQAALAHKVMPLVYHSLQRFWSKVSPPLVLHRLQELFQANARRNLFLSSELARLLKILDGHGINAIAVKGPMLSVYAYGSISQRQYIDLDILVRKRDILKAKDLLLANGFRLWRQMTAEEQQSHLASKHAFVLIPASEMYSVDLHWAMTRRHHSYSLDDEELWNQAESISFAGRNTLTFKPEQMILILATHGSKHSWRQLGWICDVAQLIRSRPELDWQRVIREAENARCLRELFLALHLAKNLAGATLPDSLWKMAGKYPGVKAAARRVTRRLFSAEQLFLLQSLRRLVFLFRLKQRVKDGVVFLLHELKLAMRPNSKDYALVALPEALSFLYYILRPIRLTVSYGLLPLIRH